jgi:predicted transcriptional regulator
MRRLGELEAGVMAAVWSHDVPVTVRTILDALDRDPAPTYTTVITVVERLRARRGCAGSVSAGPFSTPRRARPGPIPPT